MADDDALFQKGMPIRREVLGPEYVDASRGERLERESSPGEMEADEWTGQDRSAVQSDPTDNTFP